MSCPCVAAHTRALQLCQYSVDGELYIRIFNSSGQQCLVITMPALCVTHLDYSSLAIVGIMRELEECSINRLCVYLLMATADDYYHVSVTRECVGMYLFCM